MVETADGLLFPHDTVRPVQKRFIADVWNCLNNKRHMIAHAPTGLGKTVAALAPALTFALQHNLNIIFLTSRHTQHTIALETLKKIKEKHSLSIIATSVIGKKWMCSQPNVESMGSGEFSDFCRALREKDQCEFYLKTKKKTGDETADAAVAVSNLGQRSPLLVDEVISDSRKQGLCPYEIAQFLAQQAHVLVTDYYYVFHPRIAENFLNKIGKKLENTILIIDEGHNLPARIRETMSSQLSNMQIANAIKEANKFSMDATREILVGLQDALNTVSADVSNEGPVEKDDFLSLVKKIKPVDIIVEQLEADGQTVRATQRGSAIGSIAEFLVHWQGGDDGFARYVSLKQTQRGPLCTLTYRCLDPSLVTKPVIDQSYMTLMMSGTLTPTDMYSDLLGFPRDTYEREYESPFDEKNRLTLVCPTVTTKYTSRTDEQYKKIASMCADIVNTAPGNCAIFFPSYYLLEKVNESFSTLCKKTVFVENAELSTQEKREMLERFKEYKKTGAVLMGAAAGSFGEGVDLPGDLLNCVIVVGLPLNKPDLETQQLITYYNEKFGKGWDYGYLLPALTKTLQNAGRCIRTETDRGVIVFLDERYGQPSYLRCFPQEWDMKIVTDCVTPIREFFGVAAVQKGPTPVLPRDVGSTVDSGGFMDASEFK